MTALQGQPVAARRPLSRPMSRALLWAVCRYRKLDAVPLGRILEDQGQGSFGWSILLFSVVNMLPLPIGSNVVTAIPLLLLTGQMALGFPHVRLPGFISRRRIPRRGFQRIVMRLRPLLRPIEKVIRPRHPRLFRPQAERVIGALMFVVSAALFLPIPFSGLLSAFALLVCAMGLIERDGTVTVIGLCLGAFALLVTATAATLLVLGANSLI
ncbi:exopolysaccharide biosynthesis protein [Pelagibius litoralis]|uniref:Exopolysaccharide biosynthesis protein n=1 Tax=Pelagibius litoralis TaxID=374515 RepID=A0A967F245_9PROT|nr:exopolysaccharide biosynthesis protein [Pelagibius litoralis]NIA71629.1 exopolysaccharide biosynthesis protein [Pelagibius litoralis]